MLQQAANRVIYILNTYSLSSFGGVKTWHMKYINT
jgi:hypothetical protein